MSSLKHLLALLPALLLAGLAGAAAAQEPPRELSLDDAIRLAAQHDPRLAAAIARHERGEAEAMGARGRLLPRVDFEQALTRGDHPVYAFGTRLLQGRFSAADLALPALNGPDAITDHASRLSVQVPLVHAEGWYGARAARQQTLAAEAALDQATLELAAQVVRTYHEAQLAAESARVATEAVSAARADAERVRSMLRNDMATELDALTVEVHVANMEERAIQAQASAAVALAALNQAIGLPVSAQPTLTTTLGDTQRDPRAAQAAEEAARVDVDALPLADHPSVREARASEAAASAAHRAARARFAPTLAAAAEVQSHRSQLVDGQHGESWTVGLVLQVNLFNGLQDLAQHRATEADLNASRVSAQHAESAVRLRLRQAQLALEAAEARLAVATRAAELARSARALEEQRTEHGMSDAAALVRSQVALLDAELRQLAAQNARQLARVDLLVALGGTDINPSEVSP